jgi:signal transduction histidine kinase
MLRYGRLSGVARALMRHAAISVVVLVTVGAAAATVCVLLLRSEGVQRAETRAQAIAAGVVSPLIDEDFYAGDPAAFRRLDDRVRVRTAGNTIQRVKVWSADGVILYCDDHRQIGLQFPFRADDKALLGTAGADSDIEDLDKSANVLDRGLGKSVDVHAGARDTAGRPILVETSFTADVVHARAVALIRWIVPVVLAGVLIFGLLLVLPAFGLARRVARDERERRALIRHAVEASSAENRRVAGELEDGVIQNLAGVSYALAALDRQMARLPEVSTQIGPLRGVLQSAQRRVHDDVLTLREVAGAQYAVEGRAADPVDVLWGIVDDLRGRGTRVEIVVGEVPLLPESHRAALIRFGQETLRNAAEHAPDAHVVLSLHTFAGHVVITVMDDGPGFDPGSVPGPADGHLGLMLLSDAADGVGARLDLRSRPGHGTTVRMSIPVADPSRGSAS